MCQSKALISIRRIHRLCGFYAITAPGNSKMSCLRNRWKKRTPGLLYGCSPIPEWAQKRYPLRGIPRAQSNRIRRLPLWLHSGSVCKITTKISSRWQAQRTQSTGSRSLINLKRLDMDYWFACSDVKEIDEAAPATCFWLLLLACIGIIKILVVEASLASPEPSSSSTVATAK